MNKPTLKGVIEYNGETFHAGDIVHYKHKRGFGGERTGKIVNIRISEKDVHFDYSSKYKSGTELLNITDLVSISHAAEQEE